MDRETFLSRAWDWQRERQAIFDQESETGKLDHDAIWASDDDAVRLLEIAIEMIEGGERDGGDD